MKAKHSLVISLKAKIIIILALLILVPCGVTWYMIQYMTHTVMRGEISDKLTAFARVLDNNLGPDGFEAILKVQGAANAPKNEKIKVLNAALSPITEEVAKAYPGLGIGYYSKDLDAILTYGPAAQNGRSVGKAIGPNHKGREVMATNRAVTVEGKMVRGEIMNAMIPLDRGGKVIGYIWANELTAKIDSQISSVAKRIYFILGVIYCLIIALVVLVLKGVLGEVRGLISGVRKIDFDLTRGIPESKGEFKDVSASINGFLSSLRDTIGSIRSSMDESEKSSHSLETIMEKTKDAVTQINEAAGKIKEVVLEQSESSSRTASSISKITDTINIQNDTIQKQKDSAE